MYVVRKPLINQENGNMEKTFRKLPVICAAFILASLFVASVKPEAGRLRIARLYDATDSASISQITPAPPSASGSAGLFISDVTPEPVHGVNSEFDRSVGRDRKGNWRFGRFTVNNPDSAGFILQVTFDNGGVLKHEKGNVFKLVNLAVVYRNADRSKVVVPLAGEGYNGGGFVYEVQFSLEKGNVLARYEMELWGALDAEGFGSARSGRYSDEARFTVTREQNQ